MITLALYANGDGEAKACIISHAEDAAVDTFAEHLPDYNKGCTVFMVPYYDADIKTVDIPEIYDEYGQEISREYIDL